MRARSVDKPSNKSTWMFLFIILYKALLDYSYHAFQFKIFTYAGFDYSFDVVRFCIGWFTYIICYVVVNNTEDEIDAIFLNSIFYLSIAPFITLYQYSQSCLYWMVLIQILTLFYMRFLMGLPISSRITITHMTVNYKNKVLRIITSMVLVFYFLLMFAKFGIPSLQSLGLSVISQTRKVAQVSTADSVIQSIVCRVICPLYILISWKERKWFLFFLGIFIQVYSYGISGFKTYLFIPIALFGIELLPRLNIKKSIVSGLLCALLVSILIKVLFDQIIAYALIGDRVLFFSAKIKYAYFDFFSRNDYVYFSQNSISKILGIPSNYSTYVPFLIGDKYFNKPEMWTNTGFIADAFSNGGVVGVIAISTVLSFVLLAIKRRTTEIIGKMKRSIHGIFLIFFIMLHDGPFLATFVSGGMIFALLVVLFVDFNDTDSRDVRIRDISIKTD